MRIHFALVAACLWILVLYHDTSCNWHPSTQRSFPNWFPRLTLRWMRSWTASSACMLCIFCIFDIFCIFLFCVCVSPKKNGKDAKEISLIGQGFQGYLNHLFWYLPFSTAKQAHDMLAKKEMSDEPWIMKSDSCWIELQMISERAGKNGLQSMGLEGRALVPLQSFQPLASCRCSVIKLELCACACEPALGHSLAFC